MESAFEPLLSAWTKQAGQRPVSDTIEALKGRGSSAELVPDKGRALGAVTRLIPDWAEVVTGASKTLEEI